MPMGAPEKKILVEGSEVSAATTGKPYVGPEAVPGTHLEQVEDEPKTKVEPAEPEIKKEAA